MKKDDLEAVVRDTVKDKLTGVKAEMEKKMTEQEKRYDKKIGDLREDYDKLLMANNDLKEKLHDRSKEVKKIETVVKQTQKIASQARVKANRKRTVLKKN